MENEFELDEEYPEMSDAQARDIYNYISLYLDGYIIYHGGEKVKENL